MRTARKVNPHPFAPDGAPDFKGNETCRHCPLPRGRRDVHEMPTVPAEIVEAEARRAGEYEGDE